MRSWRVDLNANKNTELVLFQDKKTICEKMRLYRRAFTLASRERPSHLVSIGSRPEARAA
jgi:hypothetical protein